MGKNFHRALTGTAYENTSVVVTDVIVRIFNEHHAKFFLQIRKLLLFIPSNYNNLCMEEDDNGFIKAVQIGGEKSWYMLGHVFWAEDFSHISAFGLS